MKSDLLSCLLHRIKLLKPLRLDISLKSLSSTIKIEATEQYFPVTWLCAVQLKEVLSFQSVHENPQCDLSIKSYSVVLLCFADCSRDINLEYEHCLD